MTDLIDCCCLSVFCCWATCSIFSWLFCSRKNFFKTQDHLDDERTAPPQEQVWNISSGMNQPTQNWQPTQPWQQSHIGFVPPHLNKYMNDDPPTYEQAVGLAPVTSSLRATTSTSTVTTTQASNVTEQPILPSYTTNNTTVEVTSASISATRAQTSSSCTRTSAIATVSVEHQASQAMPPLPNSSAITKQPQMNQPSIPVECNLPIQVIVSQDVVVPVTTSQL